MQEDSGGLLHLKGLQTFRTTDPEEALSLFFLGATNRITSATPMNHASSRSHAIFTMHIESRTSSTPNGEAADQDGQEHLSQGKLHLVDLAGSERVYKSRDEDDDQINPRRASGAASVTHDDKTRFEGRNINLSLHYLEQVIVSLQDVASGQARRHAEAVGRHIPYRNSVLTSYLRDALGGNCRTAFIVTVCMVAGNLDETLSTCRFANRCAQLEVDIERNRPLTLETQLRRLEKKHALVTSECVARERDIAALKQLLKTSLSSMASLRSCVSQHAREILTEAGTNDCRSLVERYLRHDPGADATIHGDSQTLAKLEEARAFEAETEIGSASLEHQVDLLSLPSELQIVLDVQLHASSTATVLDGERANAAVLRQVARLLRSHAEYAAEMAAKATNEVEGWRQRAQEHIRRHEEFAPVQQQQQHHHHHVATQHLPLSDSPMPATSNRVLGNGSQALEPVEGGQGLSDALELEESEPHDLTPAFQHGQSPREDAESRLNQQVSKMLASRAAVNSDAVAKLTSRLGISSLAKPYDTLAAMLIGGNMFIKHGRRGKPQARWLWLSPDQESLLWRRNGDLKVRTILTLSLVVVHAQEVRIHVAFDALLGSGVSSTQAVYLGSAWLQQ